MRDDIAGLFWDDTPAPKVVKEKIVRTPPKRTWEDPSYLPYLDEARRFDVPLMDDAALMAAHAAKHPLVFDIETYPNYFLCSFRNVQTKQILCFEFCADLDIYFDIDKLRWIIANFCIVGFNSRNYDLPIIALALDGCSNETMQWATEAIILHDQRPDDILRKLKVKPLAADHIDLIEVCPLRGSLKAYGGRLHSQRMQDLPIAPGTILTEDQMAVVRWYNVASDLPSTELIFLELAQELKLRVKLSEEYKVDLRSRSDAQIAEVVIGSEIQRLTGYRPRKPKVEAGSFRYEAPKFLRYETPLLNWAFDQVRSTRFDIDEFGEVELPQQIKALKLNMNRSTYQMGLGGLHSTEQSIYYTSDKNFILFDRDVRSYYPQLILNSGMYPPQLGTNFIRIYQRIVDKRTYAKMNKMVVEAEGLKITVNGAFGKGGSPHSILYAPQMMIFVTITGQLSLLMLIERLELAGIPVVSANTDGVVVYCPRELASTYLAIVEQWERDTRLPTEEATYSALYMRDVNSYVAVKPDGKTKCKGAYFNPWNDPDKAIFRFHKNPVNLICMDAVEQFLVRGTPTWKTIGDCNDVRSFVTVRKVTGGAVKDGEYLGKTIRWYYAEGEQGDMVYASSGNLVPRSSGARPLLNLPGQLPPDLDRGWYVQEARSMLADLGLPAHVAGAA